MGARRRLTRKRVLVALTTGRQFAGIVMNAGGGLIELADAELVGDGQRPVPADGRIVVEWSRVEWIQLTAPRSV